MKRKLRDRLYAIEQVLKEMTKQVRAIQLTHVRVSNKDDDSKAEGDATRGVKPKRLVRPVKRAFGKARKQTKR